MFYLTVENPDKFFMTSDCHYNHMNICRYCNRPFETRKEMNNVLISNWNSVIPEDGIVVCCGDFMLPNKSGFKEYEKIVKQLNGTIYLTRGNHDRIPVGEYCLEGESTPKMIVNDLMMIEIDDVEVYAQHYPCLAFNGDYQIFGHIHTCKDGTVAAIDSDVPDRLRWNQYDVGVDQNNYIPLSWEQLKSIFEKRKNKNILI